MDLDHLTGWVTQKRFGEYIVVANQDVEAVRKSYEWNVAISAAFYQVHGVCICPIRSFLPESEPYGLLRRRRSPARGA